MTTLEKLKLANKAWSDAVYAKIDEATIEKLEEARVAAATEHAMYLAAQCAK